MEHYMQYYTFSALNTNPGLGLASSTGKTRKRILPEDGNTTISRNVVVCFGILNNG
jgi:hypothetical protein